MAVFSDTTHGRTAVSVEMALDENGPKASRTSVTDGAECRHVASNNIPTATEFKHAAADIVQFAICPASVDSKYGYRTA